MIFKAEFKTNYYHFIQGLIFFLLCLCYNLTNAQINTYIQLKTEYTRLSTEQKFDSALIIAKKINKWTFQNIGDSSLQYAISFRDIGTAYYLMEYQDSGIYYCKLSILELEKQNKIFHKEYATSLNNLGVFYANIEDFNSAITFYKLAIKIRKKTNGIQSLEYLKSLNILAELYDDFGFLKEAIPLFKESLEIKKTIKGTNDSDYINSLFKLAVLYKKIGEFKSAEYYYLQTIESRKRLLGEHNSLYAASLNSLGVLYMQIGEFKKSEILYQKAIRIFSDLFGIQDSRYIGSLQNLAILNYEIGNYSFSESLYKQILDSYRNTIEIDNVNYIKCLNNLALLYDEIGNYNDAELYYKQAIYLYLKKYGNEDLNYLGSLNNLAILYDELGNFSSAEILYKQILDTYSKTIGKDSPEYIGALGNLGLLYYNLKKYKIAEELLNKSSQLQKKIFGEKSIDYAIGLNNLAMLYHDIGDHNDTLESLLKLIIQIRKEKLGIDHVSYAESLENLAIFYESKGDYLNSEELHKKAIGILEKKLSVEHPLFLIDLNNLACLYSNTHRIIEAFDIFRSNSKVLNNIINKNFEWLTDKEKDFFWEKNKSFYNTIDLFSTKNVGELPEIAGLSYNSNLISKGKLLEAKIFKDNNIYSFNDSLNNKIDSLKNHLLYLRRRLVKMEVDENQELIEKLNAQADSLDKVLTLLWPLYATQKKNLSISWEQVQINLAVEEVAIEFVRYYSNEDSNFYYNALILRKNDVNPILVPLCKEDQIKSINTKEGFSDFYPLIWAPMEIYLKDIKTIYYSPVGLLNNISFGAIYPKRGTGDVVKVAFAKRGVGMESSTISEENADYLMKKYSLHQLTSTRYLAMGLKEKLMDKIEKSIVLIGGVNYNYLPNDKKNGVQTSLKLASRAVNSTKPLKYLAGTKIEVDSINKRMKNYGWQTTMLIYDSAIEESVVKFENQNAKGILHIATHGFAFPNFKELENVRDSNIMKQGFCYFTNPLQRCGLLLSGANWAWMGSHELKKRNPESEDGILTAAEVSLLNLRNTKLVVLSACETGLGKIIGNEGVFGLKRAFKLAGVEQMIVSLWEVPD